MTREGTAGRHPKAQIGAPESGIDKAIKKTKEVFDGHNEATDYEDVKGEEQMKEAKEYSKKPQDEKTRDTR